MAYLLTHSGTVHVLGPDGDTLCGRDLEGDEHHDLEDATIGGGHVCQTCEGKVEHAGDAPQVAQGDPDEQLTLDVEPRPRGGRRHRRHLGF